MRPIPKLSEKQRKPGGEPKGVRAVVFPVIASAIENLYRPDPGEFVPRRPIVQWLLSNKHSRLLIQAAYDEKSRSMSLEKYTGKVVDWFSQTRTVGEQKWLSLHQRFKRSDRKIEGCWAYKPIAPSAANMFPDEIDNGEAKDLPEGAVSKSLVNAYERNPLARQICIKKYGTECYVCHFSFGATYGAVADGFIHVHHLSPLSKVGKGYEVDPIRDLRPVCPNCHAVIHRRNPPYEIEDVQSLLAKAAK